MNFLDERLPARFWDKVFPCPVTGCWLFVGASTKTGYGQVRRGPKPGRVRVAHRYAYEALVGPVPSGLELDHRVCQQRCCVNPDHLEPVTHIENIRRSSNATKTHCPNGHEYTPENTLRDPWRKCRICTRTREAIASRERRARKRAA